MIRSPFINRTTHTITLPKGVEDGARGPIGRIRPKYQAEATLHAHSSVNL